MTTEIGHDSLTSGGHGELRRNFRCVSDTAGSAEFESRSFEERALASIAIRSAEDRRSVTAASLLQLPNRAKTHLGSRPLESDLAPPASGIHTTTRVVASLCMLSRGEATKRR